MPKTAIWFLPGDPRNSAPQYQIFPHLMWLWVDSKCAASFDGVVSNKKKKSRRWKAFSEENRIGFPVKYASDDEKRGTVCKLRTSI